MIKIKEDATTGVKVTVSYTGTGDITINQTNSPGAIPLDLYGINIFIEITSPETMQIEWAYIEIPYDENSLPSGADEEKLSIYYWDNAWKKCNNTGVDTANNMVYANVTHFTIFAPMAEKTVTGPAGAVNWMIYAGVISAVIVILAVSLIMMKKRKKVEAE